MTHYLILLATAVVFLSLACATVDAVAHAIRARRSMGKAAREGRGQ